MLLLIQPGLYWWQQPQYALIPQNQLSNTFHAAIQRFQNEKQSRCRVTVLLETETAILPRWAKVGVPYVWFTTLRG